MNECQWTERKIPKLTSTNWTKTQLNGFERCKTSFTHPSGGIEFSQQEEDVLMAWLKRLALTDAVRVVTSYHEAGWQLLEARRDVRLSLVQLSQLTARTTLWSRIF